MDSRLQLALALQDARARLQYLETYCECCQRMFVCQDSDGRWCCWFCDPSNQSSWKCPNSQANHLPLYNHQQQAQSNERELLACLKQKRDVILGTNWLQKWNTKLIKHTTGTFTNKTRCVTQIIYDVQTQRWGKPTYNCNCPHDNVLCSIPKLNSQMRTKEGPNLEFLETLALLEYRLFEKHVSFAVV
jgi:hypothetical protein